MDVLGTEAYICRPDASLGQREVLETSNRADGLEPNRTIHGSVMMRQKTIGGVGGDDSALDYAGDYGLRTRAVDYWLHIGTTDYPCYVLQLSPDSATDSFGDGMGEQGTEIRSEYGAEVERGSPAVPAAKYLDKLRSIVREEREAMGGPLFGIYLSGMVLGFALSTVLFAWTPIISPSFRSTHLLLDGILGKGVRLVSRIIVR